jgi:hypothetical protein
MNRHSRRSLATAPNGELQRRANELSSRQFVGGRAERFELDGRLQLIALVRRGLTPDSPVVDVGCGALRAGYWLIHFLDEGMYHGVDPTQERVDAARSAILEPGLEKAKRPSFSYNGDFNLGVFDVAPRFVLARSIWSHAAKWQIQALLDSFAKDATPDALLLASYHPAGRQSPATRWRRKVARIVRRLPGLNRFAGGRQLIDSQATDGVQPGADPASRRRDRRRRRAHIAGAGPEHGNFPDYEGDVWGGGRTPGGLVGHSFEWIANECSVRGLTVRESTEDQFARQVWLEVRRSAAPVSRP